MRHVQQQPRGKDSGEHNAEDLVDVGEDGVSLRRGCHLPHDNVLEGDEASGGEGGEHEDV